MEQRVSLVTLGVRDVGRARRFYDALGWQGTSPDGEVVFYQCGGMVLGLWDRRLLAEDSGAEDSGAEDGGGWGGIALAHNVASPAEVDAVLTQVEGAGGRVTRRGADTAWGGYSGAFMDTEGHAWEVAHNPGWALLADGSVRLP